MINKIYNRLIGLQRYALWNFVLTTDSYYVSEFPKSGGTWFCQMLSELVGIPFPRNQFVSTRSYIMHSHLLPHSRLDKPIIIIRDGRDVMISAYHHFILPNDHCPIHEQRYWINLLNTKDIEDVEKNLYQFINCFHQHYSVGGRKMTWQNHTIQSDQTGKLIIKYEDLLHNPKLELIRALEYLSLSVEEVLIDTTIDKYSFAALKKQNPESNFLRKGIQGDWKNYFNNKSGQLFHQLGGQALSTFDYISDQNWYKELRE